MIIGGAGTSWPPVLLLELELELEDDDEELLLEEDDEDDEVELLLEVEELPPEVAPLDVEPPEEPEDARPHRRLASFGDFFQIAPGLKSARQPA